MTTGSRRACARRDALPPADAAVLDRWARDWGADPLRVQGPGANLSCKHGDTMRIKASGLRLDATAADRGWTDVDLRACRDGIPRLRPGMPGRADEEAYAATVVGAPRDPAAPRPSMELGMHALLPARFVAHLHSLAGILVAAMRPDDPRARALLAPVREAGLAVRRVPAVRPGLALTWAIQARAKAPGPHDGALFLVAGHGVVWAHDAPDRLAAAEAAFERAARDALGLDLPFPPWRRDADGATCDLSGWPELAWDPRPAFPDFAVFFPDPSRGPRRDGRTLRLPPGVPARDAVELAFAQAVLCTRARALGVAVALPPRVARTVADLRLERLRRAPARGGDACTS
jgi:hypothetical protein